ncbi:MAG: site-specific integrase, partial [Bacteroidales bacterium]|nr:site-specific integrase [Bacteroidales bacterium]
APVNKQYFQKSWDRMRKATGLPKEMQLYSLRDTGLIDLLHAGVDQLTVQHHADHSSLAIQNIYTDHYDAGLNERVYNNAPIF